MMYDSFGLYFSLLGYLIFLMYMWIEEPYMGWRTWVVYGFSCI